MSIEKAKQHLKEKEEKVKHFQKRHEEITEYNLLLIAAVWGRPDAGNAILEKLADSVEKGSATEDQLQLVAKILRDIANNDQAANFLFAGNPDNKPFSGFFQMQKIFDAVKHLNVNKRLPLVSNTKGDGAFKRVAERFYMSEAKVKRNYYNYKRTLERVKILHLRSRGEPENIKIMKFACKHEFNELMSALTEEMTDEQKQDVRARCWPSWVENYIDQYLDV
jgi:hypothetical protein